MKIVLPSYLLKGQDFDERWLSSPFLDLKMCSPKTKGSRMEEIAKFVLSQAGNSIFQSNHSDFDFFIGSSKFELKGSTITKGTDDHFSFLQIRPDQIYDYLMLMTLWFDGKIEFYSIPKSFILSLIDSGLFKKQHGGISASSRTFYYNSEVRKTFTKFFFMECEVLNV